MVKREGLTDEQRRDALLFALRGGDKVDMDLTPAQERALGAARLSDEKRSEGTPWGVTRGVVFKGFDTDAD